MHKEIGRTVAHVELIIGPAGAGKTRRALLAYRAALAAEVADRRFGSCLWITPTGRSRKHVLRSLTDSDSPVCFGPRVLTFEQFAEQVLRSAPITIRPLSRIGKRKLLRDLIDDLRHRKQLPYFAKVAGTTGFLDLCIAFISELKRAEIWPEQFTEIVEQTADDDGSMPRGRDARSREIALIYDAYQQRLHAAGGTTPQEGVVSGLYDAEGRFWSARTLLQEGHCGPFQNLTCVVVDGFTDFTRTQYEILDSLAGCAERVHVTLPGESRARSDEGRFDLFEKTTAALAALRAAFAGHEVTERRLELESPFRETTFGHLAAHLFDNPREVTRSAGAKGLAILSCVRRTGELEAVAERVKSLLLQGVAAEEIVVAFRTLDGVGEAARAAFEDAGIPVAVDCGRPIATAGVIRFLFSLLDLELEDWPFRRLTGVLNAAFYRPKLRGFNRERDAAAVTATLRWTNLESGRDVILAALRRRLERADERLKPRVKEQLVVAEVALRGLSDRLDLLRQPAPFATWVDRLLLLATKVGLAETLDDAKLLQSVKELPFEAEAWRHFVRLIEEAKNAESLCGAPAPAIDLAEFRKQLLELLQGQTCPEPGDEFGKVRVLSAEQVRNVDVPHLFICGMSESSFPTSRGDDCLYGDAERHRLAGQGLPLNHRARLSREEMLLFYGVVTRARTTLTLSYPSVDDSGEPFNASPYIDAVLQIFEAGAQLVETHGSLDPVPKSAAECLTASQLRVFATSEALAGRAGLFASLADSANSSPTALSIVAAAEMATARFQTRGLTPFEGMLTDPRNIKRLRKRFGVDHEFSATELETYAENPFRYFLQYVLGLDSIGDPGPATDHSRRGSAMHTALAALHRRMATGDPEPNGTLIELLQAEIDRALPLAGDSPLLRALRRIEREILSTRATRYGTQWDEYVQCLSGQWDAAPAPTLWEVPFGNAPSEEGDESQEQHPVVEFGVSDDIVRVRGRIDRIDTGSIAGQAVFNVIDYKMSRSPSRFSPDDVELGRALQLLVYSFAVRKLSLLDGDLFQFGFWSLNGDGFVCGLKNSRSVKMLDAEVAASLEEAVNRTLPKLANAIRNGVFPLATDDPAAEYNGEYNAVARLGPFRAVAEVLEKVPAGSSHLAAPNET